MARAKANLLILGASILLAYAASLPLWIRRVSDGAVIPPASEALIGMIALLALVGVATYIRLREEVHAQVSNFYYTADHGDAVHDPQLFVVS